MMVNATAFDPQHDVRGVLNETQDAATLRGKIPTPPDDLLKFTSLLCDRLASKVEHKE